MAFTETADQKPGNLNFEILVGRIPVGISKTSEKERIKQISKVFTVDIKIKRSVLRVSKFSVLVDKLI